MFFKYRLVTDRLITTCRLCSQKSQLRFPSLLCCLVLLSVLGNGLVLVICYRRRKKMVGSELLCVNLAVVDFLCCICFYPLSIVSSFHHAWLGENITCVYYGLGCFIFGLCSMFTITAISIIRYLKTCYSLVYGEGLLLSAFGWRSMMETNPRLTVIKYSLYQALITQAGLLI